MENITSLMLKSSLSSLDTSSLSSRVYERLLTAIVRQELQVSQSLDVENLARSFGVSRTPVQLAQDVHELFEVRGLIEGNAVRKGAKLASESELMALKGLIQGLQGLSSGDQYIDYHAFLEQDRQFHSTIVTLGKNRRLVLMYNQARTLIELTRASANKQIGGAAVTHERHMAIVEALVARDGEKAAVAVEEHIQESEQAIIERLHFSTG
jgi:DNA-binding GntR family transcriptional regulator